MSNLNLYTFDREVLDWSQNYISQFNQYVPSQPNKILILATSLKKKRNYLVESLNNGLFRRNSKIITKIFINPLFKIRLRKLWLLKE
jgi:hypothetical protein